VDNTQNIISFCTGYGGLELGIRRAGVDVRTVVNVEIEAFCCANLVAKTEEGRMDNAPIWTDLKTFPAREFRGKIHGLIGGYPCQPFSSAGKRQGEKDPRHLWPYLLKHVRAIRPVWCFWENVAGHTTMGLWRVLSDLEEEGYRCAWGIFSAEEVGAPHQRKRVFILARLGNSPSLRPHRGSENCEGEQSEVLGERLESDELANSDCDEQTEERGDNGEVLKVSQIKGQELSPTLLGGESTQGGELANPTSRQPRQSQARNGGQDTSGGSEEELADSVGGRFEQCESESKEEGRTCCESSHTQWPARPGEEQYEWEEPRVVVDSKESRLQGCGEPHTKDGRECEKDGAEVLSRATNTGTHEGVPGSKESTSEAQSKLGGATNGTQHRVDRLRLLGNGVVPQTAELAWTTLWKELISPSPQEK